MTNTENLNLKIYDSPEDFENKAKTYVDDIFDNFKKVDKNSGKLSYDIGCTLDISKTDDYLYDIRYDIIDYDYALEYFKKNKPEPEMMCKCCSSVRYDNLYGRNFDWIYGNQVEFVVKTPANNNRHGVIGVAGQLSKLTKDFVESKKYDDSYRILPFMIVDGINDSGLVCNTNVVPMDYGSTFGTIPEVESRYEICSLMLPRFILDNFSNINDAIDYIKKYVSVYVPTTLHDMKYETHIMLADKDNTYVIEFVKNRLKVIEVNDAPYLTNFYIYDINKNDDGSVYTPETQDEEHNAIITNNVTKYGSGLERYNLINDYIGNHELDFDMWELLEKLNYTNAYNRTNRPFWYTEFVGGDNTVTSNINNFVPTINAAIREFENRDRDSGLTWQTNHSSLYDIENKTLALKSQENNVVYEYNFNYCTKQDYVYLVEKYNELRVRHDNDTQELTKQCDDLAEELRQLRTKVDCLYNRIYFNEFN